MMNPNELEFVDNSDKQRFELTSDDGPIAILVYERPNTEEIALIHTEVPVEFEGLGIGSLLVEKSLQKISKDGLRVASYCPFVSSYMSRHRKWEALLK